MKLKRLLNKVKYIQGANFKSTKHGTITLKCVHKMLSKYITVVP